MDKLKDLKEYLPIFTLFMIFTSAIGEGLFYALFKINIFKYLEIGEFSLVFINNIIYFFIFVFLAFLYSSMIEFFVFKHFKLDDKSKYKVGFPDAISISLILLLCFLALKIFIHYLVLHLIIFFLILVQTAYLKGLWEVNYVKSSNNYLLKLIISSCVFLFAVLMISTYSAIYIKNRISYCNAKIVLTNRTIDYASKDYFVGKTKNFIFLCNDSSKESEIIPATELRELKYKFNGYLPKF